MSRSSGQSRAKASRHWWLWPGLQISKAGAIESQAKAAAFRPSRAGTSLLKHPTWMALPCAWLFALLELLAYSHRSQVEQWKDVLKVYTTEGSWQTIAIFASWAQNNYNCTRQPVHSPAGTAVGQINPSLYFQVWMDQILLQLHMPICANAIPNSIQSDPISCNPIQSDEKQLQ